MANVTQKKRADYLGCTYMFHRALIDTAAILYLVILRLMRRVIGLSASLRDANNDAHNYRVSLYSVRLSEAVGGD